MAITPSRKSKTTAALSSQPYYQYANDVIDGTIEACLFVQQACQRFVDDIQAGEWTFDPALVDKVANFCQALTVTDGPLSGTNVKLMPWQWFAFANMYGFVDKFGARRFREATIYLPKGNAKSSSAAMLALYHLCADGEGVPQVYATAVTQEQAKIVWASAIRIINATPALKKYYNLSFTDNNNSAKIKRPDGSVFLPLSSERNSLQGKNVAFAAIDEIASHPTDAVYSAMTSATAKRKHPMIFNISTATGNSDGIGKERWDYGVKVLSKQITDDRNFVLLYTIDEGDDPYDPAVWIKANPGMGVTVMMDGIASEMNKARQSPSREESAFTFHLNKWYTTQNALFSPTQLKVCADPTLTLEDFVGEEVVISIDLAWRSDLTGVGLTFCKTTDGKRHYYQITKAYLNEDAVINGANQKYAVWRRPHKTGTWLENWQRSLIQVNSGNMTSWDDMIEDVVSLAKIFKVKHVSIDRFKAPEVASSLQKAGLEAVVDFFPQNFATLNSPTCEFEAAYREGRFHYDGNPVFEWNVGCVIAVPGPGGAIKPGKNLAKTKTDKIDLFICCVMGIARWLDAEPESKVWRGYDNRAPISVNVSTSPKEEANKTEVVAPKHIPKETITNPSLLMPKGAIIW